MKQGTVGKIMRCGFYIEAAVYAIASIVYAMVENEPQ